MALCTVSGKLVSPTLAPVAGATITFTLQVPSNDIARQPGQDDINPNVIPSATTASDGTFSVAIVGNDQISPSGTTYLVTFTASGKSWKATYSITGSTFDLTSAQPVGTGSSSPAQTSVTISINSSAPGNMTVAHGLGRVPVGVTFLMTSSGEFWFQTPSLFDGTNLYLVASDSGVKANAIVW